jgi:antagonist of KipI
MGSLTIIAAGPLTTVQDLGRSNHRGEGISVGGALDLHAARVANLLVANAEESALLEITHGPFRARFVDERIVACCGAAVNFSLGQPIRIQPDETLELSPPARGCRSWLAISGGIDLPPILGSRATDLRTGFGGLDGRALRDGDVLPLGPARSKLDFSGRSAPWTAPNEWTNPSALHPVLRVVRGSEWETFAPSARLQFLEGFYIVSQKADRMGARLQGPALDRDEETDMISEAVTPGTIQVANDRQPILLLGDCQTLGGYTKIAHVITVDLPLAAQLQPNDRVRFQLITLEKARVLLRTRAADLDRFRIGLQLRMS